MEGPVVWEQGSAFRKVHDSPSVLKRSQDEPIPGNLSPSSDTKQWDHTDPTISNQKGIELISLTALPRGSGLFTYGSRSSSVIFHPASVYAKVTALKWEKPQRHTPSTRVHLEEYSLCSLNETKRMITGSSQSSLSKSPNLKLFWTV